MRIATFRRGAGALLLLLLALVAVAASSAQARRAVESAAQPEAPASQAPAGETPLAQAPAGEPPLSQAPGGETAASFSGASTAEERAAARRARREAKHARRESRRGHVKPERTNPKRHPGKGPERENAVVRSTCTAVSWTFRKFPDVSKTTIVQRVRVNLALTYNSTFSFEGTGSATTTAINAPPGATRVDANAHWRVNGVNGGFDIHTRKICPPVPSFSIEKLQRIGGENGSFTTSPLTGEVGQTVEYEIIVQNTGNVPLQFSNFYDPHCDPATVAGGPGEAALAPGPTTSTGASSTYTCDHVLTRADQSTGSYRNYASDVATPPPNAGVPIPKSSNTVVVNLLVTPSFSIEKLQRIATVSGSFTTSPLTGEVGQTVEYEIVVTNTGNVPLKFSAFSDPQCDAGTISGGPGATALAPGGSSTYVCHHLLSSADQAAGSYSNVASDTATSAVGEGPAITHGSNTVVVGVAQVAAPPNPQPPSPRPNGPSSSGSPASSSSSGASSPSSGAEPAGSGVLAFTAATVPSLHVPQGCVRSSIHVHLNAAGVAHATFYLDGHRLKTLTSRNARNGVLTIVIDPATLSVGAHRLKAEITMARRASTSQAAKASRTAIVLRCRATVSTPKFTG